MSTPPPKLDEKDFIQENYSKNPYPFWIWLAVLVALLAIFWTFSNWYNSGMDEIVNENPFLQVTNRDMSLFLWQFPEYMRINAPVKNGYLPGFKYIDRNVGIEQGHAEDLVSAPPDVLFLYHTWDRLLRNESPEGHYTLYDLRGFLNFAPEWLPANWPKAPDEYKKLIEDIMAGNIRDLSTAVNVPPDINIALTGWKNFYVEGSDIDKLAVTAGMIRSFLKDYPHYARNYWLNILKEKRPNYLKSLPQLKDEDLIPSNEMVGFLKVAIFNQEKADQ